MRERINAHMAAASVLLQLSDDIEMLGGILCSDPALVSTFMHHLQMLDLIAQKQRAIASALQSECPMAGIEAIGLNDLKMQLLVLMGSD